MIIYPEGTATRDPDQWPMVAKTGVARLALSTGVPVIPVAQWGAQAILPYGEVKPHAMPRKLVRMLAGPPVDLSDYEGKPLTRDVLRGATNAIMATSRSCWPSCGAASPRPPPTTRPWPAALRGRRPGSRPHRRAGPRRPGGRPSDPAGRGPQPPRPAAGPATQPAAGHDPREASPT